MLSALLLTACDPAAPDEPEDPRGEVRLARGNEYTAADEGIVRGSHGRELVRLQER
ncbi:hypothetical protein [Nannocystis punicea]|uniref:Uncharacterized protein n=1 Tax=Nannocystis punicea TaxID=2995304 RepID=A0ABY7HIQ7_9BACT|nr:hypothetical protein [Nannocystis poenicansa]WAS99221.1 hypothetical protein O0S08_24090 [Nannocystis poenicansa]